MDQPPYITRIKVVTKGAYNPEYGDDRICICGHSYYRHFDSYENMAACGCKYCGCETFMEATPESVACFARVMDGKIISRNEDGTYGVDHLKFQLMMKFVGDNEDTFYVIKKENENRNRL